MLIEQEKQLFEAVEERNNDRVKYLIGKGASANAVNSHGYTALYYALQLGSSHPIRDWKEVTELLLSRGADLNIKVKYYDPGSITLLHAAARIDANAERVTFLLDKGLNVNEPDKGGWTPLHHAAQQGNVEVIKVLLARGATIDALDKDNSTPLHEAATERRTEAAEFLLQEGAKPNIQNRYGETPLYKAISSASGRFLSGHQDLINALVEASPECVYLPDRRGTNPFEWASGAANEYYFEYLQSAIAKTEGKAAQKSKVSVEPKLGINNAEPDPDSNLSTTSVEAGQQRGK